MAEVVELEERASFMAVRVWLRDVCLCLITPSTLNRSSQEWLVLCDAMGACTRQGYLFLHAVILHQSTSCGVVYVIYKWVISH